MSRWNEEINNQSQELIREIKRWHARVLLGADHAEQDPSIKHILVEGKNDKKFYDNPQMNNASGNLYICVDDVFCSLSNNKDALKQIITTIYFQTDSIVKSLYCIIDRDFDKEFPQTNNNRIMSNDTHDLETMILNTDISCIKSKISQENFIKACYMAYQIGIIKYGIKQLKCRIEYGSIRPNLGCFENEVLNINKLLSGMPKRVVFGDIEKIIKQYVKPNGQFKCSLQQFASHMPADFWWIANGHDLTYLIDNFKEPNCERIDSKYLIENYDFSKFKDTALYLKMKAVELLQKT